VGDEHLKRAHGEAMYSGTGQRMDGILAEQDGEQSQTFGKRVRGIAPHAIRYPPILLDIKAYNTHPTTLSVVDDDRTLDHTFTGSGLTGHARGNRGGETRLPGL
jgi:hypothetical protein